MTMPKALVAVAAIAAVTIVIVTGHGDGLFVGAVLMIAVLVAIGT